MNCEEWGPWIEHDGLGCPVKGRMVESEAVGLGRMVHIAGGVLMDDFGNTYSDWDGAVKDAWTWRAPVRGDVIRYRVRKPLGLFILERIAENPVPVEEMV